MVNICPCLSDSVGSRRDYPVTGIIHPFSPKLKCRDCQDAGLSGSVDIILDFSFSGVCWHNTVGKLSQWKEKWKRGWWCLGTGLLNKKSLTETRFIVQKNKFPQKENPKMPLFWKITLKIWKNQAIGRFFLCMHSWGKTPDVHSELNFPCIKKRWPEVTDGTMNLILCLNPVEIWWWARAEQWREECSFRSIELLSVQMPTLDQRWWRRLPVSG